MILPQWFTCCIPSGYCSLVVAHGALWGGGNVHLVITPKHVMTDWQDVVKEA
jgi:hypothetical protein